MKERKKERKIISFTSQSSRLNRVSWEEEYISMRIRNCQKCFSQRLGKNSSSTKFFLLKKRKYKVNEFTFF